MNPSTALLGGRLSNGYGPGHYTLNVHDRGQQSYEDPLGLIFFKDHLFVAEKPGKVWMLDSLHRKLVLDIEERVHSMDDAGLINAVLHPDFTFDEGDRNYVFILYRYHPSGDGIGPCDSEAFIRLSRFTWDVGDGTFDEDSELVLIQQYDPHCWHMGGGMFFGKDGYLYFAMGDAGGINDEYYSTQQITDSFFGGLHRIDVDQDSTRSHPIRRQPDQRKHISGQTSYTQYYYIPNDNPWVDPLGSNLEEFFALGLRNPHRMSYDSLEDKIWVADVGQARREELNLVRKGDNLQWPFMEGSLEGPQAVPERMIGRSTGPVFEYDHSVGTAIIGGFVYRGTRFPELYGKYVFADDGTRKVWAYDFSRDSMEYLATVPAGGIGPKNGISSVASDADGNIYILKLYGTDLDGGQIYQLEENDGFGGLPDRLSDLEVFRDMDTRKPAVGLLPYAVNLSQWKNGANVEHWVSIPNDGVFNHPDEQVGYAEVGAWKFPYGTVFIQHFQLPGRDQTERWTDVETRFLVISDEGKSYGVAYKWNEQGSEAYLVTETHTDTLGINEDNKQAYTYLSPADCLNCHNTATGFVLGARTAQLNRKLADSEINQLEQWSVNHIFGSTGAGLSFDDQPKLFNLQSDAPLSEKLASYLDVNCSSCHHPTGMMPSFDARLRPGHTMFDLIDKTPISPNSNPNGLLISAGEPERSILWQRINTCDALRMPPVGRSEIDTVFRDSLYHWINKLSR